MILFEDFPDDIKYLIKPGKSIKSWKNIKNVLIVQYVKELPNLEYVNVE